VSGKRFYAILVSKFRSDIVANGMQTPGKEVKRH